jgi:N-acetyl sugar amidotransferase
MSHSADYQVCARCVMDTSDSQIIFDADGICDHCHAFENDVKPHWHPDERGRAEVAQTVATIKQQGQGNDFDCILGMSGGLDSSYMLHLVVKEFGLRPLVFHVDGGWNSDIAVSNIQNLVGGLGLDLYTEVINWEEMRDFQLSWFKAGVPHLDIPQDHAFVATLYHFANKHGIKYILNGGNVATECVRNPKSWAYYGTDMRHIHDVHGQFGSRPLKTYPLSSVLFHKVYLRYIRGVKVFKPLDLLPYTKQLAIDTLRDNYGWKAYPQKHFESRFTRFIEGYWLPTRFGYDTRRVQFSSLILTDQMTRDDAMSKLESPAWDPATIDDDFAFIASKLRISVDELRGYHEMPLKSFRDYKNQEWMFDLGAKVLKAIGAEKATKR